ADRLMDDFFFQAEDGIRDRDVTGVQTCALPISANSRTGIPEICVSATKSEPASGSSSSAKFSRDVVIYNCCRLGPPNVHAVTWRASTSMTSSRWPWGV